MNRVDRLMSMLWTLQYKKYVSAETFVKKYDLSLRTIYRDIKALNEIGVPVYHEPGKGYCIMKGYFLPPLLFTRDEANSLLFLHKLANRFVDKSVIRNADAAFEKIKTVLKYEDWEDFKKISSKVEVYIPQNSSIENDYLSTIQNAIIDKNVLKIDYVDKKNNRTYRAIESIGLIFYTNQWHLIAWCKLREEYRDFIVPQISKLTSTSKKYEKEHSYTIQDYMKIF